MPSQAFLDYGCRLPVVVSFADGGVYCSGRSESSRTYQIHGEAGPPYGRVAQWEEGAARGEAETFLAHNQILGILWWAIVALIVRIIDHLALLLSWKEEVAGMN